MDENRIRVRLEPEMTPVRLQDKMDLHAEIEVQVDSRLTGLGLTGLAAIAVGLLCLLFGVLMLGFAYPAIDRASSLAVIERVVVALASGVILLFLGTSMFFYGRTVLGSGSLDQFTDEAVVQ